MFIAVRTGLEPATPCVTGMYSNQAELPHHLCVTGMYSNQAELPHHFFLQSSVALLACLAIVVSRLRVQR